MTAIRDQVYEQALEVMQSSYPELVGTSPEWPRFDRFKQVYTLMDASRIQLEQSVSANHFRNTVLSLCEMITSLQAMAICMGVDTRPIMEAIHRRNMGETEVDLNLVIDGLLEMQGIGRSKPELVTS